MNERCSCIWNIFSKAVVPQPVLKSGLEYIQKVNSGLWKWMSICELLKHVSWHVVYKSWRHKSLTFLLAWPAVMNSSQRTVESWCDHHVLISHFRNKYEVYFRLSCSGSTDCGIRKSGQCFKRSRHDFVATQNRLISSYNTLEAGRAFLCNLR